jgi:hypothetical protein
VIVVTNVEIVIKRINNPNGVFSGVTSHSMMKLKNLKYTLVNKIKIAFNNIRKAI